MVNLYHGQPLAWPISVTVNLYQGQSLSWSIFITANLCHGQPLSWLISVMVNLYHGQSLSWSIFIMVNLNHGQSRSWSVPHTQTVSVTLCLHYTLAVHGTKKQRLIFVLVWFYVGFTVAEPRGALTARSGLVYS